LRDAVYGRAGHTHFLSALRRAAVSEPSDSAGAALLFVNAGLDVSRPLATQKDSYWWPSTGFDRISQPYGNFARIVRGFDKQAAGLTEGLFTVSLDGGAGRDGPLLAVCLDAAGAVVDTLEA
jgi:serine/threonine protein phosphatase 1